MKQTLLLLLCLSTAFGAKTQDTTASYWFAHSVDSLDWGNIPSGVPLNKSASLQDLTLFQGTGTDTFRRDLGFHVINPTFVIINL